MNYETHGVTRLSEFMGDHVVYRKLVPADPTLPTVNQLRSRLGLQEGILPRNPFQSLDQVGVGRLVKMCVEDGKAAKPGLEIGICGEHGGDPDSIDFCHRVGLDYVSCSPYRVPVARLAAAQAQIRNG